MKHLIKLFFLAIIFIFFGCGSEIQPVEPPRQELTMLILFDPTIFAAEAPDRLNTLIDDFQKTYMTLPNNTLVRFWFIENSMINKNDEISFKLYFEKKKYNELDSLIFQKEESFAELNQRIIREWEFYHKEANYSKATSCIISSLYKISKLMENQSKKKFKLILISDMIELCTDWGNLTKFDDDYFNKLESLELDNCINLSKLDTIYFVRSSDNLNVSPAKNERLQKFWQDKMKQFNVDSSKFMYLYEIKGVHFD